MKLSIFRRALLLTVALALAAAAPAAAQGGPPSKAGPPSDRVVVTENDEDLWFQPPDKNLEDGEAEFTDAQAHLGNGSVRLHTGGDDEKASIATARYGQEPGYGGVSHDWPGAGDNAEDEAGVPLQEITALDYTTYIEERPTDSSIAPYLQVEINPDGDTAEGYAALVFDPSAADQQVEEGDWQTWDTLNEPAWRIDWSSEGQHNSRPGYMSWDDVRAAFNEPSVKYTINVSAGSGWDGDFVSYTDAVTIGVDGDGLTYDFEPSASPESRDDCKQGGWEAYGFANRGQCIRYVNTGQDSR